MCSKRELTTKKIKMLQITISRIVSDNDVNSYTETIEVRSFTDRKEANKSFKQITKGFSKYYNGARNYNTNIEIMKNF